MTGAEQRWPGVVGLRTRPGYQPDVASLACSKVAAAREHSGLSVPGFAAALHPLLGWLPSPSVVRAWESTVPPPGPVMIACELLSARGDAPALAAQAGPSAVLPDDSGTGTGGYAATMQAFRTADLQVGGGQLYATVVRYLKTDIAPRLVLSGPGNGEGVFTPAAAISEMAGWMAHDAGHDLLARQHFDRALELVSVSGDRQVTAHILASIGHLATHLDEPHEALRASDTGLDVLRPGPCDPDLEAHLLAIRARAYAALHRPSEAISCLTGAEKALTAERDEPRSEWVSGFDEGSLASDAARCMRQLGQLSEALCQAERVIALRPPGRRRSRAFGMLICTDVLIARGDLDQACVVAAEVLEATDALASYLVVQQFLDLRRRLKPYASHVAVREFLARLNPTIRERLWFKGPLQAEHLTLRSPGVLA